MVLLPSNVWLAARHFLSPIARILPGRLTEEKKTKAEITCCKLLAQASRRT
jgi:hypothetical protein